MLETRLAVRRQAEQQKNVLVKTVEQMKKKGNFDKGALARLGIDVQFDDEEDDTFTNGAFSTSPPQNRDISSVKMQHREQMDRLVSEQTQARQRREIRIDQENDEDRR